MTRVLILVQQHHLVPGALPGPHLGVPTRDHRGQRHLIPVIEDFPCPLSLIIRYHERQKLLPHSLISDYFHNGLWYSSRQSC